ncbi:MAG: hypothetical protein KGL39_04365 [Patescibacteria group bacterium]|nr:hypothetical protein [Patescibacteria group bacterium]
MTRCVNTCELSRSWTNLVNKDTMRTLQLGPNESADVGEWQDGEVVDLPSDFKDPFLVAQAPVQTPPVQVPPVVPSSQPPQQAPAGASPEGVANEL